MNHGTSTVTYVDPDTDEEYEITFDWWYSREYDDEPAGYDFDIAWVSPPTDKDFREFVSENADWANLRFEGGYD
jgi:hypothetical protein